MIAPKCKMLRSLQLMLSPYLAHIGYIKVDEVTETRVAGDDDLFGQDPDPLAFPVGRPVMGVVAAKERFAHVAPSRWIWTRQAPEGNLVMAAIFVCGSCVNESFQRGNSGISGRAPAQRQALRII